MRSLGSLEARCNLAGIWWLHFLTCETTYLIATLLGGVRVVSTFLLIYPHDHTGIGLLSYVVAIYNSLRIINKILNRNFWQFPYIKTDYCARYSRSATFSLIFKKICWSFEPERIFYLIITDWPLCVNSMQFSVIKMKFCF